MCRPCRNVQCVIGAPRALQHGTPATIEQDAVHGDGGPRGWGRIMEERSSGAEKVYVGRKCRQMCCSQMP